MNKVRKLTVLMVILSLSFSIAFAGTQEDYRSFKVIDTQGDSVEKPIAQFQIKVMKNGSTRTTLDSPKTHDMGEAPLAIAYVGETLAFKDLSQTEEEHKIIDWDFQVAFDKGKPITTYDMKTAKIKLTKKGVIDFYLCVRSDHKTPPRRIEPWSDNGNYRTLGIKEAFPSGVYWYFSHARVQVLDTTPTPTKPRPAATPTPTRAPRATATPVPTPVTNNSAGGDVSLSIVKTDGINKLAYQPQWRVDSMKAKFMEAGYTFGKLFDIAKVDRSCYPSLSFDSPVNWDTLNNAVEKARKYKVRVSYSWTQTTHQEWRVVGSHMEDRQVYGYDGEGNYGVIRVDRVSVNDYGWVTVNDPEPLAQVTLRVTATGKLIKSIKYNIASGADAAITYSDKTDEKSESFTLTPGQTKEFEFTLLTFSNVMNGRTFNDSSNGVASIIAVAASSVPSKDCPHCSRRVTYTQPANQHFTKNILIDAAKIYPHNLHLTKD